MRDFGIQLNGNTENGEVMDLAIDVVRDTEGKIVSGLKLGNTLEQNKALLLIAAPGDFKLNPTLGVGIEDILLDDELTFWRHRIRQEFSKDKLNITRLDVYTNKPIKIDAQY